MAQNIILAAAVFFLAGCAGAPEIKRIVPEPVYVPPLKYEKHISRRFNLPPEYVFNHAIALMSHRGTNFNRVLCCGMATFLFTAEAEDFLDCGIAGYDPLKPGSGHPVAGAEIKRVDGRAGFVIVGEKNGPTDVNISITYQITKRDREVEQTIRFESNEAGRFDRSKVVCRSNYELEKQILDTIEFSLD